MSEHIDREYMEDQIGGIVDYLDEVWHRVAALVIELGGDVHLQDACVDLRLRDIRDAVDQMSKTLWREDMPGVLDRYFPAQRDDAQDRAITEARGE